MWVVMGLELLGVLSVDHEVEHWFEVSVAHGGEVEEKCVPGIVHDWTRFWVKHVLIGDVEGLNSSLNELSLVVHDNLVLILLDDLTPVCKDGTELVGVSQGSDLFSESDNLWELVHGGKLHLSEFVVLMVEDSPLIIVDVDVESLVWLLTRHGAGLL